MLVLRMIVSQEELMELIRDSTYTKVEVRPTEMKRMRDVKAYCYLKAPISEINGFKGTVRALLCNPELPQEVRDYILDFTFLPNEAQWIKVSTLRKLRELEKKHNVHFSIPRKYNVYIENIETNDQDQ